MLSNFITSFIMSIKFNFASYFKSSKGLLYLCVATKNLIYISSKSFSHVCLQSNVTFLNQVILLLLDKH